MFEKDLAYQSDEPINWCPSCKTGLALEDLEDGKCERCGSEVEKKKLPQWVLKITNYADKLLEDLDELDWPESIKESQRNWIGRSEGSEFEFKIKDCAEKITVFTTRPDTFFGITYLVLAPENPLVQKLEDSIQNFSEVKKYIEGAKKKTDIERGAEGREKTGVSLEGVVVIHPATGEEIPVWIADYVLASYGTGAVMAVPAHDQRDFEFAQKYDLPIKQVVAPFFVDKDNPPIEGKEWSPRRNIMIVVKHPEEDKIIQLQWKQVPWKTFVIGGVEDGESYEEGALRELAEETGYKNIKEIKQLGWQMQSHFYAKHKDLNRKAFPRVFWVELKDLERDELSEEEKAKHEVVWVPMSDFPETFWPVSELSEIQAHVEKGDHAYVGEGVLINSDEFNGLFSEDAMEKITDKYGQKKIQYKLREWVFSRQRYWGEPIPIIHCQKCGAVAVPEKDLPVMLPDVESYEPTGTGESPLAGIDDWVNTKCPKCGGKGKRETNTMPQWAGSCWYYLRYMNPDNKKELVSQETEKYWSPVDIYVGGAEHATRHLIYARFWHKFLYDIGAVSTEEPFQKLQHVGLILAEDGRKMSKRYGNIVNPDDVVDRVGADAMRVYEMFMGPFDQLISWSEDGVVGPRRFLEKVWRQKEKVVDKKNPKLDSILNQTIKKVTEDISSMDYNTAISSMMECINVYDQEEEIGKDQYTSFIQILAPFAPHITEELWSEIGGEGSIHLSSWPEVDESKIIKTVVNIAVQVNGKVRGSFEANPDIEEGEAVKIALDLPEIKKRLGDKKPKKTIFVREKIVSIVI